ncbi:MAG: ClpXP protease specificity-enhancing factor [Betaproteobacteria bacterium RBG_16_58_11]|nr:MAG: ClpXP protease specificity-enhancing factor [Betaproteobacteria bacterium RBG_16_58_11]OFZ97898.1 MAG: ClpXP protease specificity-enhancing factor [Betaproteobacteria bacterium RBG_19FT_COMBO_58_11]
MYDSSTKPYLIRAIYEWCVDQSFTPYVAVQVDDQTKVPLEFIKDGQIVLNVSYTATRHLKIGNEFINFSARFNGSSRELEIPIPAVIGIFAKENGQGMFFQATEEITASAEVHPAEMPSASPETPPPAKPPRGGHLKIVK